MQVDLFTDCKHELCAFCIANREWNRLAAVRDCTICACRGEGEAVNEKRWPLTNKEDSMKKYFNRVATCYRQNRRPKDAEEADPKCRMWQRRKLAPFVVNPAHRGVQRIALFHYATRSKQDFAIKKARGGGSNRAGKSWKYFEKLSAYAHRRSLVASWMHWPCPSGLHVQSVPPDFVPASAL